MSAIAAVWRLDGARVYDSDMVNVAAAMTHYRPDRVGQKIDGTFGLLQLQRDTTPQSLACALPLCNSEAQCWIAADCRLDNREELLALLRPASGVAASDAELILAAYLKWREECPRHLEGDFAFAIWDSLRQRLFLARDVFGTRPLFYARLGRDVVASSTVGGVASALRSPTDINRPLIREYLHLTMDRWLHQTARQDIHRLPPAHALVSDASGDRLIRYYDLGERPPDRQSSDGAYAEQFAELFARSVSSRLRALGPVGVLMSGGVDSGAVASEAARLASRHGVIRSYTACFDETPSADERALLKPIFDFHPSLIPTLVRCDEEGGFRGLGSDDGYPADEPELDPLRPFMMRLMRLARHDGCRVMLSGLWADQVLTSFAYSLPHLLRDLSARQAIQEFRYFRAARGEGVAPVLLRMALGGRRVPERASVTRSAGMNPARRPASGVGRSIVQQLQTGIASARQSAFESAAATAGIEVRAPFLDRALVEFLIALPASLTFRGGINKFIMRRGLHQRVPRETLERLSHAHLSEIVSKGLEREKPVIDALKSATRICDHGFMTHREVDAAWRESDREPGFASLSRVARLLFVEAWLGRLDDASGHWQWAQRHSDTIVS